jgi:hypothetical protein
MRPNVRKPRSDELSAAVELSCQNIHESDLIVASRRLFKIRNDVVHARMAPNTLQAEAALDKARTLIEHLLSNQ